MTGPTVSGAPGRLAADVMSRRCYGSLDAITDSERRALRPIGMTAREAADRTGALLAELLTSPGVRIFQGVRLTAGDLPRVPHVVSAGRVLLFIDSVAWPSGRYAATRSGRVLCDGVYIGQSVRPLVTAARHWQEILPAGHRVRAWVVVHSSAGEGLALPGSSGRPLAWAHAGAAVRGIRAQLPRGAQAASMKTVAALVAATAGP